MRINCGKERFIMLFEQIKTIGLGCYSYAIGCPIAGVMAVVDPRRDIDIYLRIADEHDMHITHIFETHVHADHVSGAQDLRISTGADVYIHDSAPVIYDAKKLNDGDEFTLGNATMRVVHTPGHTPDSVSFLISDLTRSQEPGMILTGDLLFVGDVGRPDLPGDSMIGEQVRKLYDSLYHTLNQLPDYMEVYPAHGEGSLCGQGMSAKPHSTLGYERLTNPMLKYPGFADFKDAILSNLPMRPRSFTSIISANINGAENTPKRDLAEYALSANDICKFSENGAVVLDLRDALAFGAAHIPDSINVDFSDGPRLNWVGMAVPPGVAIVLVLAADNDFEEICTELQRIGYDNVKGWLKGGFYSWMECGKETQSLNYISASALKTRLTGANPPALIDVSTPREFSQRSIDGAVNFPIDRIISMEICPVNSNEETVIICQSGFRAGIAASILQAKCCDQLSILTGGMIAWQNL